MIEPKYTKIQKIKFPQSSVCVLRLQCRVLFLRWGGEHLCLDAIPPGLSRWGQSTQAFPPLCPPPSLSSVKITLFLLLIHALILSNVFPPKSYIVALIIAFTFSSVLVFSPSISSNPNFCLSFARVFNSCKRWTQRKSCWPYNGRKKFKIVLRLLRRFPPNYTPICIPFMYLPLLALHKYF